MPLAFRNVTATPADPVADWPTEAIRDVLERGDLEHWQRVAGEIRRHPWGRTARQVEEVLGHTRPYGVAELMEDVIDRARSHAEQAERDAVAAAVRQAIADSGLTRSEFASRIGTSASRLSICTTGKVMPSAGLLLRIRRAAARESTS